MDNVSDNDDTDSENEDFLEQGFFFLDEETPLEDGLLLYTARLRESEVSPGGIHYSTRSHL